MQDDEPRRSSAALPVTDPRPQERGDAARNRALLLDAARRLIAERGADAVTMDDIAAAAGVGKGTLFRRFGSRAGLMMVLLDEDEKVQQQAFLFGPPPLGPDAPPLDRLLAFGRERLWFVRHPPRAALGGQPRPADPLQRAGDAAAHPRPAAARRPRAPPVTSTRRPTRCWRCSTPTTCTTNSPTAARRSSPRRRVGERGAQALRHDDVSWVLHVDLDQFQAAVEVRRHPELAGLPIIVGGNGDPDRTAQGRHVRVVSGARVRRARRHAAAHGGAQMPGRDVPAARTPTPTTRRPKR